MKASSIQFKSAIVLLGILTLGMSLNAQEVMSNVKVGDPAPDFTLLDQNGNQVKLSDFRGKKNVVLAFYVLAFTGG